MVLPTRWRSWQRSSRRCSEKPGAPVAGIKSAATTSPSRHQRFPHFGFRRSLAATPMLVVVHGSSHRHVARLLSRDRKRPASPGLTLAFVALRSPRRGRVARRSPSIAIVWRRLLGRLLLGECTSGEPGAGRPVGAAARTRKQRRPRSRRTLAELSKCRGPANARDACREASDEQAPEQGTPCRFGERSSEPAARSALTSRGSAPTTTSGGEYYPPLGGVAIPRESAEAPVRAGANLSASHRESVRWGTFSALASGRP